MDDRPLSNAVVVGIAYAFGDDGPLLSRVFDNEVRILSEPLQEAMEAGNFRRATADNMDINEERFAGPTIIAEVHGSFLGPRPRAFRPLKPEPYPA